MKGMVMMMLISLANSVLPIVNVIKLILLNARDAKAPLIILVHPLLVKYVLILTVILARLIKLNVIPMGAIKDTDF
jgi:hypothetical protein